ncbi:MAG TPA: FtsX-like permease family protein [Planctomycetota bacterium]|nr:FtsX-like permease family protein [Planctomycetota bacterium]
MYKLFMALRYLRAHRIIYFSIAGVAFGIAVMILVTSVMGGFSRDMRSRIRGVQSHILVRSASHDLTFTNYQELAKQIKTLPHVTGCAPRLEYLAWLSSIRGVGARDVGESSRSPDVYVIGIDPEQEHGTGELEAYFGRGDLKTFGPETFRVPEGEFPAMVVGSEITHLHIPEVILQTARQADFWIPLRGSFQIVGWFKTGMAEYDSKLVFLHLTAMQRFLQAQNEPYANVLAVGVDDYERNGESVRENIIEVLHAADPCSHPEWHSRGRCKTKVVRTWEEERRTLLQAVEVEKGIQIIIIMCIVVVAGFNIIAIYTLMVRSKTRDIGVLKALGSTPGGIVSTFLLSGGACGVVGSIIGIGAGLLLSRNLNELVDFVRISSRELNRLRLEGSSAAPIALGLLTSAMAALIFSWIGLYRRWHPRAWIWAGATALLVAAGSWFFFSWIPTYEPREDYDWLVGGSARFWITAGVGLLPLLWTVLRQLAEPFYHRLSGSVLRVASTFVYSILLVAGLAGALVANALVLGRPGARFAGYDLFPRQIYYLDRVPIQIEFRTICGIVIVTLVISVIFSIYPAMRAARTDPIEAIRDE